MSSNASGKDVIYIDVDDEITTIIDKVRGSHERIVALVLPKRATVLQSIVNMKLLKRTADESKKHLVLITSEAGLLPLAGAVGIYVARSLQSRPEVPTAPAGAHPAADDTEEAVDMSDSTSDKKIDKNRPIGDYAGGAAPVNAEEDAPIELDNATPASAAAASQNAKGKKDKKLKIPDFNKFRTWMILGACGLVVLIFVLYLCLSVLPKASVVVKTDSEAIESNLDVTFSTDTEEVDVDAGIVPAVSKQTQKTVSQQVDATGQKDKGTKAEGEVKLTLKDCSKEQVTIPAGTGVSSNGLTFIMEQSATLTSVKVGNQCRNSDFPNFSSDTVSVTAQNAGDKYNVGSGTSFSVAGYSNVSGAGSGIAGGTSNIVKVVAQGDVDSAKQKISSQDTDAIKAELADDLRGQGLYVVDATFIPGTPETTQSAQVGDEVSSVTVTQKITYTLLGAKQKDIEKLITNAVNEEIDTSKQAILDHGLSEAVFKLQNQQDTETMTTLSVTAVAGSDLNLAEIKKQIAGKKSNDAKEIIGSYPGVTEVTVDYSPFWVSSIPKKTSKITLTIEKPKVKDAR